MIHAQARGGPKAALVEALRQHKRRRGLGRGIGRKPGAAVPSSRKRLGSCTGPRGLNARLVPGHWEGDLLKGAAYRSSVGTLLESKTRFVTQAKMEGNGAAAALEGFTRQMVRQDRGPSWAASACRTLPGFLRKSLTDDRGVESLPAA